MTDRLPPAATAWVRLRSPDWCRCHWCSSFILKGEWRMTGNNAHDYYVTHACEPCYQQVYGPMAAEQEGRTA